MGILVSTAVAKLGFRSQRTTADLADQASWPLPRLTPVCVGGSHQAEADEVTAWPTAPYRTKSELLAVISAKVEGQLLPEAPEVGRGSPSDMNC